MYDAFKPHMDSIDKKEGVRCAHYTREKKNDKYARYEYEKCIRWLWLEF